MRILVRSRADAKAIGHVVERYYPWASVETLGGKEKTKLEEKIEAIDESDYTLVLLGREDRKWVKRDLSTPVRKVEFFWKARVRNGRLSQLVSFVEKAKHRFVTDVRWEGEYVLGQTNNIFPASPGEDILFLPSEHTLLVWDRKREWVFFSKGFYCGKLDRAVPKIEILPFELEKFEKIVRKNLEAVEKKVEISKKLIRRYGEGKTLIVPWSGGKDSTAVLLLAREVGDVVAVFVDSGADFPEVEEYIDKVSKKLRIEVHKVEAPIAKKANNPEYLLTRSCTQDKIRTLYSFVQKNFENPLMLSGDRISESKLRSFKPEFWIDELPVLTPIKYWSFADIQIFLESRGIPLNPLYSLGFNRIGCSFCPFLDNWEKSALKHKKTLIEILERLVRA